MNSIAIVGGGIAGIYTAWRLVRNENTRNLKVTVFESTSMPGGRIRSQLIPPLKFKAELGAMRFHPTHHLLRALIADLNIPTRTFDISAPHLRVRGRTLTPNELVQGSCSHCGASIPYQLRSSERDRSPDQLVHDALHMMFRDLSFPNTDVEKARFHKEALVAGNYSPALWTFVREYGMYENVPLRDIGFWNLLQHYLSNEAFSLVHTAMSLESVIGNWNAAEAIPWFMADYSSPELWMVPGGMSRVIDRMLDDISRALGEPDVKWLRRSTQVTECVSREGKWMLTMDEDETQKDAGPFHRVIFAVPLEALKRIRIHEHKQRAMTLSWLDEIETHRLFKVFLLFENPWWISSGVPTGDTGRTYTDLPLRQVYYFHPDWMERCVTAACTDLGGDDVPYEPWPKNFSNEPAWEEFLKRWPIIEEKLRSRNNPIRWSLVMASYSDEHHVSFWRPATIAAKSQSSAVHYNHPEGLEPDSARILRNTIDLIPDNLRIRSRTVQKILQQLREIHGQAIPEPIAGVYMDWNEAPFRAGWHTWIVGSNPDSHHIADCENGLHFCGEAWSRDQGWIEGALKTAECVLASQPFQEEPFLMQPTKRAKLYVDGSFNDYIGWK